MISVQVSELLQDQNYQLELRLLAGQKGLGKKITIPRIQKPGLALTGDTTHLSLARVQVLGRAEMLYLKSLTEQKLKGVFEKMAQLDLAVLVLTRGEQPPPILVKIAETRNIPLCVTSLLTSSFVNRVTRFLEDHLTASTTIHGVMVDVLGVGILILGTSGIGKSEAALDLIMRNHRLVGDDAVEIKKKPPHTLMGMGRELIKYHMEIRGLGILNIKDLFGIGAIRDRKILDMVVELEEWDIKDSYDRLGLENQTYAILEIEVPYLKIPVRPGRNVATVIEVAARNYLLKQRGHWSAQELEDKLAKEIEYREKLKDAIWHSLE